MELPKNAKRVFTGVIFDIYQWKQKLFDGTTATFETARRQDTVVIIATVGGKILVLHQRQPTHPWYYALPSGRMDKPGETPKGTALRELLEETGYKPGTLRLWKKVQPNGKIIHTVYFFVARNCKRIADLNPDGGEEIEVGYYSFEEFLKLSDHPRCFLGPLMIDVLQARIHKDRKIELKKAIFG